MSSRVPRPSRKLHSTLVYIQSSPTPYTSRGVPTAIAEAPMLSLRTLRPLSLVACLALAFVPSARANHGPGASGGGSATMSGETIKLGHYELTLREDYAQFQPFNFEQASARARRAGVFDSLNHGFIPTADFSYGVTDDLQLGASIGYFIGSDFKSASLQPDGSVETSRTDPTGLTDALFL